MATNNVQHDYMPKDYYLAKKICQELYKSKLGGLDIKTQVTLKNNDIYQVVVAIPILNDEEKTKIKVENIVKNIINVQYPFTIVINGTGSYKKHGPIGDCGTTGRKLAVDFYGGNCKVGGGSPWTKDGTKADLTLNLYARQLALDYIKKHIDQEVVYVSLACTIGKGDIFVSFINGEGKEIESNR